MLYDPELYLHLLYMLCTILNLCPARSNKAIPNPPREGVGAGS